MMLTNEFIAGYEAQVRREQVREARRNVKVKSPRY
jgi:hypothetical protein